MKCKNQTINIYSERDKWHTKNVLKLLVITEFTHRFRIHISADVHISTSSNEEVKAMQNENIMENVIYNHHSNSSSNMNGEWKLVDSDI